MSFFGLGGFELLLIGAIALFVLGPKRLLDGIRDGRKIYTDLKRQRDALQSLITEAIDLDDLKKQVDADGLKKSIKSIENDLKLDQVAEDILKTTTGGKSIPRDMQFTRPHIEIDPEVRDAIPDLNITGGSEESSTESDEADRSELASSQVESDHEPESGIDEVKS